MAAIVGLLGFSTLLARHLRARYSASGHQETLDNLVARIDAWWVMVALSGLALAFGRAGVIALFGLLSFAALREYMSWTPLSRFDHGVLVLAFFVAVPVQYSLIAIGAYGLYSILIPVYGFILLPVLSAFRAETRDFLKRTATAQWGLMMTVYCLSYAPALATLEISGFEGRSLMLVVYLVLVTQLSDVLQYVAGKLWGRRPIAPALSPGKTLEGTVVGIAGATLIGVALHPVTPFSPWVAGAMSLLIAGMGFLGGLVMSAIKRDFGIKDWGSTLPGHGGVLDRMDSVVFSAPVFFHLTRYFWA